MTDTSDRATEPSLKVCGIVFAGVALCLCPIVGLVIARRDPPYVRAGDRSLRDLVHAQDRFWQEDPDGDGPDFGTLSDLLAAGMIDPDLASGTKYGYRFQLGVAEVSSRAVWMATATPMHPGWAFFAVDQTGTIRRSADKPFPLRSDCKIEEAR